MTITLKDYADVLPKELMALAEKNKVRECDETEKGHFVAYVDDGNDSYDVVLNFTGNELSTHTCDCKNGHTFCRHKAALLMHIARGKKVKAPVKAKKKENKTEILLDQIEATDLKEWVRNLLHKNKDLELSFIHYFSTIRQLYTPEDVKKLVAEAIKVVLGNRKTAEAIQLKRLTELWTEMLRTVVEQYQANVTDEGSFLNFHTMLEDIISVQYKIETTSNKLPKFVEGLLQRSAEAINNLQIEESWDKAIRYFIRYLIRDQGGFRSHYLVHLNNIAAISIFARKEKITDLLVKQYGNALPESRGNAHTYTKMIFLMVEANDLFSRYYTLFKPIPYDNDYNLKLIQLLIKNHHFEIAEKYCRAQIMSNYKTDYNVIYWEQLKEIYTLTNDEGKLAEILAVLFPFTYDFDDYLIIASRIPEEERKKWRTKMLSRASNASNSRNTAATVFCFRLMDYEKNHKKMIEYIDSHASYSIITPYFEKMILTDKAKLIETMLRKHDDTFWIDIERDKKDDACFPELYALVEKNYTPQYLKMIIAKEEKDRKYYRLNRFMSYVKEQLEQVV